MCGVTRVATAYVLRKFRCCGLYDVDIPGVSGELVVFQEYLKRLYLAKLNKYVSVFFLLLCSLFSKVMDLEGTVWSSVLVSVRGSFWVTLTVTYVFVDGFSRPGQ